jgi:hypothetical protein
MEEDAPEVLTYREYCDRLTLRAWRARRRAHEAQFANRAPDLHAEVDGVGSADETNQPEDSTQAVPGGEGSASTPPP